MADAEAMLQAGVVRARKDEIRQAELSDRIEALQLERLEEGPGERLQADPPVNRVRDPLRTRHPREQRAPVHKYVGRDRIMHVVLIARVRRFNYHGPDGSRAPG